MGLKLAETIRTTLGQDVVDSIDIGPSLLPNSLLHHHLDFELTVDVSGSNPRNKHHISPIRSPAA